METNSPASTNGAKGLLLHNEEHPRVFMSIPVTLSEESAVDYLTQYQNGIIPKVDLLTVEYNTLTQVLEHGSATGAYAVYRSTQQMREKPFLSYPQWAALALALVQNMLGTLDKEETSQQTTA